MKRILPVILLLLVIHLVLLVNLRFTAWPEMLSYPYLRNNGYLLYKDMIHPYPPVLTLALSIVYKIFGYKLIVLKLVTWLIILANDILIFLIVKKLSKSLKYSFLGLTSYIILQPFLEGNQLWFDLAIVPSVLLGSLFFLNKKYFWSGVAFGVAALTKQTAGLYLVFSTLYIVLREKNTKDLIYFLLGPAILFLILMLRLITEGALSGFLNWTLIYPFKYWSHFPDYVQMQLSNRQGLVLILLILSVAIAFFKVKRHLIFYMYFLISLLLIYPRFSFFHFQLGLAFLAILYGLILSKIKRFPYVPGTVFLIFAIVVIGPTLVRDWCGETRFWAKEDVRLAEMIKNKTKPEDKIYLVGPHSGLYVLADRLPPKIWSDNYVWYLEIPQVQEKIITSWEEDPPKYVFTAEPQKGNWYDLGTYRPQKIVDWIDKQKINKLVLSE